MANAVSAALAAGGVPQDPATMAVRLKSVADNVLNAYEKQSKQWDAARQLFAENGLAQPQLSDIPANLSIPQVMDTTAGRAAFLGGSPVHPGTSSLNNYTTAIGRALAAGGKQVALDTLAHNKNELAGNAVENKQRLTDLMMYKPTINPGGAMSAYASLLAAQKPPNVLPFQLDQETIDKKFLPPEFIQRNKTGQVTGYNNIVPGPTIAMKAVGGKLVPADPKAYAQAQANFETSVDQYNQHQLGNLQARQAQGIHGVLSTPLIVTAEHYSPAGFVGGPTMQMVHMRVEIPPMLEQILPTYLKAAHWNLTELGKIKMPPEIAKYVAAWREQYMGVLEHAQLPAGQLPPIGQLPLNTFDQGTGGY